ncbi:GAF domain-containing protein [Paenimyroides viscosum]|uniref:GAF domain-containing protein n=1 Tax=Paenimyroides viscosum TaxID=2488729 RepID=A0A3P1B3Y8_9FLAO|nr:GAF domain-containing protein [Paenimyroides viscosum]RRA95728.1 GAF domain-containing protein [Paenimyroides viscosum]
MSDELNLGIDYFNQSPFYSVISFHKVIDALKEIAKETETPYRAIYAQSLLAEVAKVPELYDGITSRKLIYNNLPLIHNLLADLFPTALTANEIKAVSLPFQNFNFNFTQRFQKIISEAGEDFEINFRDFNNDQYYIFSCCLILNSCYGENFDLSRPMFYDIPDKNGVIKHYRITFNGDFTELIPTDKALKITQDDIKVLKRSYNDISVWKEKFPIHSWILKGFGIITLTDVTIENTISSIKTNLLKPGQEGMSLAEGKQIFRSIFKEKSIDYGIFFVNDVLYDFIELPLVVNFKSYFHVSATVSKEILSAAKKFFKQFNNTVDYYCVTDILELYNHKEWIPYLDYLQTKGIRSFILAPIKKTDSYQAYVEITSSIPFALHTVNANKLNDVMPLINDTFIKYQIDIKNELDAIIQREYTAFHPSVNWKFEEQAKNYYFAKTHKTETVLKEIEFENIFPLYGETDIQSSTKFRNKAMLTDLRRQLKEIMNVLEFIKPKEENLLFQQRINEIVFFQNQLKTHQFVAEAQIHRYIIDTIHPLFKQLSEKEEYHNIIQKYNKQLDEKHQRFWHQRKKYDLAIQTVNKLLTDVLDSEQTAVQTVYPHYFERFRTDGVEHNLYIGSSISPTQIYDSMYLYNLRLWQLQVMCKVVIMHQDLKQNLSFDMDLTSLILVYNEPIFIKFRLDEKRFDVENNDDIRFEVIKKRLAKAMVKNTNERLVQANKLTIVYLNETDKKDYLSYIDFLKNQDYFIGETEDITVEDLQDITDLKALRVTINTHFNNDNFKIFSYTNYVDYLTKFV